MKLHSENEWHRLEVAILGTVDGFVPGLEFLRPDVDRVAALRMAGGAFPRAYLEEVAEDLEGIQRILQQAGVRVLRPRWTEDQSGFTTPNWSAQGFDIYNVRDLHIVIGNTLIAGAPSSRFRLFETYALRDLLYDHFFEEGFRWISAPLPRLRGTYLRAIRRPATDLEVLEDSLHQRLSGGLSEVYHALDEHEVIFDAANIIRLGRDVLFLVSKTGNRKAVRWLQEVLGTDYRVHQTNAYRSSHLDSTILPLREGLVLLNGARVNDGTCPEPLVGWDKLYFVDVAPVPEDEVAFHRDVRLPAYRALRAMGVESTLEHISSPWAGLNVLSLDPTTVVVHDRQTALMRVLEARGLTVVPARMRHCYSMLGGLHCTTLDLVRSAG